MNTSRRSSRWWRFLLPFVLQFAIILVVPAQSAYTYNFGKLAVLQTMPVDPYDLLRGYSQTLSYDLSQTSNLEQVPGSENIEPVKTIYVILETNLSPIKTPPAASKIIKITSKIPADLAANQIALQGKVNQYNQVIYGLETYYLPESQRNKINQEISALSGNNEGKKPFLVEIKVDRWGNSVPISLWVGEHQYRF